MEKEFYAVKNKDDNIRRNSSSGGVFHSIASYIIRQGGIVYGAAYDSECNVYHKRVTKMEEIIYLQGSKYVQSNTIAAYKQVKEDLNNGNKVLFSGTPCQIAALIAILKDTPMDNLLLVDVICHSIPTQNHYNDYKKYLEKKYKSKIIKINMRYKDIKEYEKNKNKKYIRESKIEPHVMYVEFENGKKYIMKACYDPYYQLMDFFAKKSCFNCPYTNLNRNSDITIGDFHELSSSLEEFNDGNGVSLLIINSKKGKEVINDINEEFKMISKKESECMQPSLECTTKTPAKYDEFLEDYATRDFSFIIKKYTNNSLKFKIKKMLYMYGILEMIQSIRRNKK